MNKSLAIVAALIAAATMFASSAQAGLRIRLGFGGPLPAFTAHGNGGGYAERHYHRKRYLERRIVKKEKTQVAKRKTEPKVAKSEKKEKVAKATPKTTAETAVPASEPEAIADSENSSISTAALDTATVDPATVNPVAATTGGVPVPAQTTTAAATAQASEPKPAKSASKLDCKKFFPSVGMTLTVPCE